MQNIKKLLIVSLLALGLIGTALMAAGCEELEEGLDDVGLEPEVAAFNVWNT